jgi:hypothetical protein
MAQPLIPVIKFRGLLPPANPNREVSAISRRMGEALADGLGDQPIRADYVLEVLAIWAAALINIHPSTRDYLNEHFDRVLAERLRGPTQ